MIRVKSISLPSDGKERKVAGTPSDNDPTFIQNRDQRIQERLSKIKSHEVGLWYFISHCRNECIKNPRIAFNFTIPLALLIAVVLFSFTHFVETCPLKTEDILVVCVVVLLTPIALLDIAASRHEKNLETALSNFFRDLAGMSTAGMTLPSAVHTLAEGEYANLTEYIRRLDAEMSWNIPFVEALLRFGERIGTKLSRRSTDLIAHASNAGGNISEVLQSASEDAWDYILLRRERENGMIIYVIVVVISFFVFLFVIAIITGTFLKTMAEAGTFSLSGGTTTADIDTLRRLFFDAALIQGLCSGLVAGQMGEGRIIAGTKYAVLLIFVAWVVFRLII